MKILGLGQMINNMWQDKINIVWQGDCLELMKEMPDKCIDLVVTDPPYGLDKRLSNGGGGNINFINLELTMKGRIGTKSLPKKCLMRFFE